MFFLLVFSTTQKNTFSIYGKMEKYRGFCVCGGLVKTEKDPMAAEYAYS